MTQSNFSLKSSNPVKAAEQYFEESEQNLVRIAVNQKGDGVLIHALPEGSFEKINSLSDDDLIALCIRMSKNDEIKKLEEVLLFYECRCTDEMILNMITGLPEKQRKELWAGQKKLEIECPRCSRNFTLHKRQ
jgi:redox-regulated HSP33 family molecular chaperone